MRRYRHLGLCICIACCILLSGCTEADNGDTSPFATPRITTTTPAGGSSITPHVTQTMPSDREVFVGIRRDPIQPTITVTFNGGKGQIFVRDIKVTVTRSDGKIFTDTLVPTVGDEAIFQGTKGKDRVEVTVFLIDGKQYEIIDTVVDYYNRP